MITVVNDLETLVQYAWKFQACLHLSASGDIKLITRTIYRGTTNTKSIFSVDLKSA